jgi:2-polyprenyl-3-methyl-5-hydroxy-6-metoxy-1,4-benzoquinol methylase
MPLAYLINRALRIAGVQVLKTSTIEKLQAPKPIEPPEPPRRPGVFNIDPMLQEMLPDLLLRPATARARISSALGLPVSQIGSLETRLPAIRCDIETIFSDPLGATCVQEYRRFQKLLEGFDPTPMGYAHASLLTHVFFDVYLRNSITRLYHLIGMLRSMGVSPGSSILEVGSFHCYFAGTLQRLGYQVTAFDRYHQFGGALDGFVNDFRTSGGAVIETDEDHEVEDLRTLGKFAAVISMAVVEHIPHTPRQFLAALASHVRPGGVLALDTPNIARYFNRKALAEGRSIHQPIEYQFPSTIPFEGHHREYTAGELHWMLEQTGCTDVRTEFFEYNLFQSENMTRNLIDALLEIALDDSLCDTILAAGRVAFENPASAMPPTVPRTDD